MGMFSPHNEASLGGYQFSQKQLENIYFIFSIQLLGEYIGQLSRDGFD